jgi:hypothetical protein
MYRDEVIVSWARTQNYCTKYFQKRGVKADLISSARV